MFNFINNEYTDIVLACGEAEGNAVRARRIYTQPFPHNYMSNVRLTIKLDILIELQTLKRQFGKY